MPEQQAANRAAGAGVIGGDRLERLAGFVTRQDFREVRFEPAKDVSAHAGPDQKATLSEARPP